MSKGLLCLFLVVALVLGGVTPGIDNSISQAAGFVGIMTQTQQLVAEIYVSAPPLLQSPIDGENFPINTGFNFSINVIATDSDSDLIDLSVDTEIAAFQFDSISAVPGRSHYVFQWTPSQNDTGSFLATFFADDHHAGSAAAEVTMTATKTRLEVVETQALPTMNISVPINLTNTGVSSFVGGFSIQVRYAELMIHFQSVTRGPRIEEWQYFNYNLGDSSTIRIVGLARMTDSNPYMAPGEGPIAYMNFAVDSSEMFMGHYSDIYFDSTGNNVNTLSDSTGYHLVWPNLDDGWVYVLTHDDIRIGDINLNGVQYEVSDAVLFANRIIDPESFPFNPIQRIASDCNGDFLPETLQDFIYLINVLNGNIPPSSIEYGPEQAASLKMAKSRHDESVMTFSYAGSVPAGGFLIRLRHGGTNLNSPIPSKGLEMHYADNNEVLSILIYDSGGNGINPGQEIFSIGRLSGSGELSLMEFQISDKFGNIIPVRQGPQK